MKTNVVCSSPRTLVVLAVIGLWVPVSLAQQALTGAPVPRLVQFSGLVKETAGRPVAGVTFALYKDQEGGTPIWLETQNVPLDESGRYTVLLGSTKAGGLPMELFTSGEARWLGSQPEGQPEQPRVLLLSVPYALKAADAETVGGLPPSAFALATVPTLSTASTKPAATTAPATSLALAGSGTLDFIPLWTPDGNTLGNSLLFQSTAGNVGINTTSPAARLDVGGTAFLRGAVTLPAITAATSTKGQNSNSLNLLASSFSSTANAPVNQKFRWQVEPTGNNTPTTSGTLNLLFGQGAGIPVETGVVISSTGTVSANGVNITGQPVNAVIGNAGCNGNFSAAIGFPPTGVLNCTDYALLGDTGGNTYLNSAGEIFFLNSNSSLAVLDSLGNLTLQGSSGNLALDRGSVTVSNGNVTINGTGHGVTFPDGTTQTTASAGAGGTGTFSGSNTTQIVSVAQTNTGNAGKAILATASGAGAVAISGLNTNTTGTGVSGGSGNNGIGVSGVVGTLLGNSTGTGTGVSGVSFSNAGTGVSGRGFNGVQGTSNSSTGIAGVFDNTVGGLILSGRINGIEKFHVDGFGNMFVGASANFNGLVQGTSAFFSGQTSVAASSNPALSAISYVGNGGSFTGGTDSNGAGWAGLVSYGGNDTTGISTNYGGAGIQAQGGNETGSAGTGGTGIIATGGKQLGSTGYGGDGIVATGGEGPAGTGVGGLFYDGIVVFNDVNVLSGNLYVQGTKNFKIDHPLDAANKYLYHAAIESSEVLNLYRGRVTLDASGEATVQLPQWFEALNKDFNYQLTAIGAPAPNLYIAEEIQNNTFRIAGGTPGMSVSWQVTGVRNDAYENAHPMVVEVDKPERERGYYLSPELFGAPEEKGVEWARNPRLMQRIKEIRARQQAQLAKP